MFSQLVVFLFLLFFVPERKGEGKDGERADANSGGCGRGSRKT